MIMQIIKILRKALDILFNARAAVVYILIFAISIGAATFIENDFGTSGAQKVVYRAWWFELLLVLFGITLIYNIIRYKFIQSRKWANLILHSAMIIILLGAGLTRFYGYDGIMHIREGSTSNTFLSSETYLLFNVSIDDIQYKFDEPLLLASVGNNHFSEEYELGNHRVDVRVIDFIPNPITKLEESNRGSPIAEIVVGGAEGRESHIIKYGEAKTIHGQLFNFTGSTIPNGINLLWRSDSLFIKSDTPLRQMIMASRKVDTLYPQAGAQPVKLRSLYENGQISFVFSEFLPSGQALLQSESRKIESSSSVALRLKFVVDGNESEQIVYGTKGLEGIPVTFTSNEVELSIAYGSKPIQLPFQIKLYDFIMERYPGTNSAASYASNVQLIDHEQDVHKDFKIYMNHILNYRGYRFFQSSYDRDEQGTYLSVNHDFWGTWVSYIGYAMLTIGLLLLFFSKNTRFNQLSQSLKKLRTGSKSLIPVLLFVLVPFTAFSQKEITQDLEVVSVEHANSFSKIIVQDVRGRMKPMHTLTRELLRKISRKESFNRFNADQVILSMYVMPDKWYSAPLIKVSDSDRMKALLDTDNEYVSYRDLFTEDGDYKLKDAVEQAFETIEAERGTFEKELIKVDERVNIMNMIFTGSIFKIIPVPDDPNNTWVSSRVPRNLQSFQSVSDRFFDTYKTTLHNSVHSGDYTQANKFLADLVEYQQINGSAVLPSRSQVNTEILMNKLKIFNRLALYYIMLGFTLLILLFVSVFKPTFSYRKLHLILLGLVVLGFLFHTVGLGLRWYVSGRAPWSNGYESMIYIAFTTSLAGIIFTRKSLGGLAATNILSGVILLIAYLSYLDPEITPLVPVLKSYWLTIHVSLEAGSYGFLMLGAVIGLINLLLFAVLTEKNKPRIKRIIQEMTYVSEMTIIGGIVMLSIGTYLGGVWANESWGRYWGWDAKETWALVSILVYAFILHMRLIPKIYSLFSFNLATLFGLGSVIMTYFGVNYYLSGLHSYATGDPVPIPNWVYISVVSLIVISAVAYLKKRRYSL